MDKGQFYLIAMTFAAITLTAALFFIVFTETSAVAEPAVPDEFENLLNAAQQRNDWVEDYWFNLNWSTRRNVNIVGGISNPVRIGAATAGFDCRFSVRVFNRTATGAFNEVPSNVSSATGPCDAIFNGTVGFYEIYWNATPTPTVEPAGRDLYGATAGLTPTFFATTELAPSEGLCSHMSGALAKVNIDLSSCSGTGRENSFNYTVNFTTTDFNFDGALP